MRTVDHPPRQSEPHTLIDTTILEPVRESMPVLAPPSRPVSFDIVLVTLCPPGPEVIARRATNVPRTVRGIHGVSFEWGSHSEGAIYLAQNILNAFVPPRSDGRTAAVVKGGVASATAIDHAQDFARRFLFTAKPNTTISATSVRSWAAELGVALTPQPEPAEHHVEPTRALSRLLHELLPAPRSFDINPYVPILQALVSNATGSAQHAPKMTRAIAMKLVRQLRVDGFSGAGADVAKSINNPDSPPQPR